MYRKYWQSIVSMSQACVGEGEEMLLLKSIRKLLKEKHWEFCKVNPFSI